MTAAETRKREPSLRDQVKALLARLDVSPSKARGQNFLIDLSARDTIAEYMFDHALSGHQKAVLEVGPGLGLLTEALLQKTDNLWLLEREAAFCPHLEHLSNRLRGRVIQADLTRWAPTDSPELPVPLAVVSNVPYSISTEFILWLIANRGNISGASILLQREFAERVVAGPGSRAYGTLSIHCRVFAECHLGPIIGPESFFPAPRVESRLISLEFRSMPLVSTKDEEIFHRVVHAAFHSRRKTLLNNLHASDALNPNRASKSEISAIIENANVNPEARAETLSVDEFLNLSYQLNAKRL